MGTFDFEFWRFLPIILAAPAQTLFLLVYSLRALGAGDWWREEIGRAMFLTSFTLAMLIDAAVLGYVSKFIQEQYTGIDYGLSVYVNGWDSAAVFGYWLVCLAVYHQLILLIRVRIKSRKKRRQQS